MTNAIFTSCPQKFASPPPHTPLPPPPRKRKTPVFTPLKVFRRVWVGLLRAKNDERFYPTIQEKHLRSEKSFQTCLGGLSLRGEEFTDYTIRLMMGTEHTCIYNFNYFMFLDFCLTGGAILTYQSILPSLAAGYLCPLPYNYWRLKKLGKACHWWIFFERSLKKTKIRTSWAREIFIINIWF